MGPFHVGGCTCRDITLNADNTVTNSDVETGDARVSNFNLTYVTAGYAQHGNDQIDVSQTANAQSGDAIAGQIEKLQLEQTPIIFVSGTRTEPFDRTGGILLGADDYLCKPLVADEFLARVGRLIQRPGAVTNGAVLTGREREVLGLLGTGMRPKEIAEQLCISPKTVGTHLEHIFTKLGAKHRLQAVVLARRQGLAV